MSREEWFPTKHWRALWSEGGMYEANSETAVRREAKKHDGAEVQRMYATEGARRVRWVRQ